MTTVPSFFPNSTHDELLARCHSARGNRVVAKPPKLMSSFDYEPAARCTNSDMTGVQRCASAEDSAVLARRHAIGRPRFDVPKLMSSLDGYPAAPEDVKHHDAFISLPSAASAACTPASSSLDASRSSSAGFERLTWSFGRL